MKELTIIILLLFCYVSAYSQRANNVVRVGNNQIKVKIINSEQSDGDSVLIRLNDNFVDRIVIENLYDTTLTIRSDTVNMLSLKAFYSGEDFFVTYKVKIYEGSIRKYDSGELRFIEQETYNIQIIDTTRVLCTECRDSVKKLIKEEQTKYDQVISYYREDLNKKLPNLDTNSLISNLQIYKDKYINQLTSICDSVIKQFEKNKNTDCENCPDSLNRYKKQIYYIGNEYASVLDTVLTGADYDIFSMGRYMDIRFLPDFDLTQLSYQPYNLEYDSISSNDTLNIFIKFQASSSDYLHKDTAEIELNKISDYMKYNTETNIDITGHTDCLSSDTVYLNGLSKGRAEKIKEDLNSKGISNNRIRLHAKGRNEPIAPCGDERNRRITAKYDNFFTIQEIANKITEIDSLLVTLHIHLFEKPDAKSSKLNTTVSVNRKYPILQKSKNRKQMKLGRAKLCNYWYKIRTEKGREGWVYGFYTNKKLKYHIINQHYKAKKGDNFNSIVDYANKHKNREDYEIDVKWLQFLNPNSSKDGRVTEGEDFYIKTFKKPENKK